MKQPILHKLRKIPIWKWVVLCILFLGSYTTLSVTMFIFNIGISLPPNKCDFETGYSGVDYLYPKRYDCLLELAERTNTPGICRNLPTEWRDECYNSVAQKSGKPKICQKITSEEIKHGCEQHIIVPGTQGLTDWGE